MNKILYYIMCAILLLAGCTEETDTLLPQSTGKVTVSMTADTQYVNESAPMATTRATTISRYVMEVYTDESCTIPAPVFEDNGNHKEQTSADFVLTLNKNQSYHCLLWADAGDGVYTVTDLKAVTLADATKEASEAYYAKAALEHKDAQTVTLKRAVTLVRLKDKNGVDAGKTLNLKYSQPSQLNLQTGAITQETQVSRNVTTQQTAAGEVITEFYMPASQAKTSFSLTFNYDGEGEEVVTDIPLQANYTTGVTGEYKKQSSPDFMTFTIDLTSYTDDKTFILPFGKSDRTGNYTLTIDWGDGNEEAIAPETTLPTSGVSHTFAENKEYTITITSSQGDVSKVQMPAFMPGYYHNTTKYNSRKLKAMNTPMLNTGDTYFLNCFYGCQALTTIPATLFNKNPQVTVFTSCFSNCLSLQDIPEQLFAMNEKATTFTNCFSSCGSITTIPATLFAANTQAVHFSGCFSYCTALTKVPDALFATNTQVTDFDKCFTYCSDLTTIPAKLFEKNTLVTDFDKCFEGCSALTEIPNLLFATNKSATNFRYCFSGCKKAKLNPNIFCDEATGKTTRFPDMTIDFTYCFKSCAYNLSTSSAAGTAPALWEYTYGSGTITKTDCFESVYTVSNYSAIPTEWK